MPGFDGTGPRGQGPLTGGGRGYCVGYAGQMPMGGGSAYGRWFGRGYRRGRGMGRKFGFLWTGATNGAGNITPQSEAAALRNQAGYLQEEINAINVRLKELGSSRGSQESS